MIVVIDQSLVIGLDIESQEREQILSALSILAQQAREGNHIIIGDRDTFSGLYKYYSEMDSRTKAALQRASEKLTGRKQIREFTNRVVRIVSSFITSRPVRIDVQNGKKELLLPAQAIDSKSSILVMPVFLVENINDGKVFLRLARSMANTGFLSGKSWLKAIRLRVDIMPGGGNTLCDLFDLRRSSCDRIGIAIADSDYRYPGAELRETAKRLLASAERDPQSPLLEALTLAVRTIENCIPAAEIRSIAEDLDPMQLKHYETLHARFYGTEPWHYLPIKSGIRCFELGQESAESKYWTSLLGDRSCLEAEACSSKKECRSFILEPISSQLLAKAAERDADLLISSTCGQGLVDEWTRLTVLLYSYFCGEARALGR